MGLVAEVKTQQHEDPSLEQLMGKAQQHESLTLNIEDDEIHRYGYRLCVSYFIAL